MRLLRKLNDDYNSPTPSKARKVGKAINLLGTTVQVTIAGMQIGGDSSIMSSKHYFWFVVGLAFTQWLGTTITDLYTDEQTIKEVKPDGQI